MAVEESIIIKIQANAEEFKIVSNIINKELGRLGKSFQILEGDIKQSTAAMNQFEGSSKKFNKGLMSISLILQDLPYGFRGIQNNIPALAQGLGVVYLAISAVTAAMTYFVLQGDKMSESTKKMYEGFKSFVNGVASDLYNALKPAFDEIVKAINVLWEMFGSNIINQFKYMWENLVNILKEAGGIIAGLFKVIVSVVKLDWTGLGQALIDIFKHTWNIIIQFLSYALKMLGNGIGGFVKIFNKDLGKTIEESTATTADMFSKKFKYAFAETKKETVDLFSLFKTEPKKAEKELTDFEKTIKSLELQQRKLNLMFYDFKQIGELDYLEGQIKALSSAIDDLAGQTTQDAIQKLKELIQLRGELLLKSVVKKAMQTEQPITPVEEPPTPDSQKISETFKAHQYFAELFFKGIKDKFDAIKKAAKESEEYLMKIGIGMMSALGPALDMLIDKGASIGEVLSKAFQDITKKLIKVALAAAVVVALLASFGIIDLSEIGKTYGKLVASGMGLGKDLFEGKPPETPKVEVPKKAANGGIFGGPAYRMIGEYPGARSNPEVVAPLDKLKDMIGGGGGTLEARVSGNDLLILMNKAQRNNNLSF